MGKRLIPYYRHFTIKFICFVIESSQCFTWASEPRSDVSAEFTNIKNMQRAGCVHCKKVSDIDQGRDWSKSYRPEPVLQPTWARAVFNSANMPPSKGCACRPSVFWKIQMDIYGTFKCTRYFLVPTRYSFKSTKPCCCEVPGYAADTSAVTTIRC